MEIIPLQAVPSQIVGVSLGTQNCQINVYQKATGLFVDLLIGGSLIIGGVIAQNLNRIVRDAYLGFGGDLVFIDTQGSNDPVYTGLGSRYALAYLDATDLLSVPSFPPSGPFTFPTAPSTAVIIDPAALAVIDAFATAPSGAQIANINTLVTSLKSAGVWPLLDVFYVFAAHDAQAALVNWVKPGASNAGVTGSATFQAFAGFLGDGATGYVTTNFNPTISGATFTLNSAHIAAWSLTLTGTATSTERLIGDLSSGTVSRVKIEPWTTGNKFSGLVNGSATASVSGSTTQGAFLVNRSGSASVQFYVNGSATGTTTDISTSLLNDTITILHDGFSGAFATLLVASMSGGGSLTPTQVAALYAAEHAYMLSVGAVPS